MITTHQFVPDYPILPDSRKLILGTIHPHDHENFLLNFFYGNEGSLWKILSEAFPQDLKSPSSLPEIISFLRKHKIAISDTILQCARKNPTALDSDLIPIKLNFDLIDQIKKSQVSEILFTSGFGKNNAFRLFYVNILNQKITKQIREEKSVILPPTIFGRFVKLTILYSPSGSSNVGVSKSKLYLENKLKYEKFDKPVKQFKIDYYKEKFS